MTETAVHRPAENADDEWRVAFNMNIGLYF